MCCLATLYLARMMWDMARTTVHLWQRGTFGAACHSLLAAFALLIEGFLQFVCAGCAQIMIFVLLMHGSRVPLWVFICFSGTRSRVKKLVVLGLSLLFSAQLLAYYYFAADHIFSRGVTIRRALYDAAVANNMLCLY